MRTALSNQQVTIRRYNTADVPFLFEAARESSAEVGIWLPWCHSEYSMEESLEWVVRSRQQWNEKREFHFGIFDRQSGAFVGGVGLNEIRSEHRMANLGYWVRTARTREGVATAAASLAAEFGAEDLLLDRIEILVALGNKSSQRVAEKLGAHSEGLLRSRLIIHGKPHDAVVFSLMGSPLRGLSEGTSVVNPHPGVKTQRENRMNPAPVVLNGAAVRLEPLDTKHAEGLFAIGQDERIWRYLLRPKLESVIDAQNFV